MNKDNTPAPEIVQLASRDWVGLLAVAVTIMGAFFAAYSRHDRMLSEVSVSQQLQGERINRLEGKIDQMERDLRGR